MNITGQHPQLTRRNTPLLGNFLAAIGMTGLLTPRTGIVIEKPGTPALLSMGIVGALGMAIVAVALLKKKKVI